MSSGFPAVLLKPDTCWRMCEYVYARLQPKLVGPRGIGDTRTVACAVRDSRSERRSDTRAKSVDTRAARDAIVPVVAAMSLVRTNTGLPSSASAKRSVGSKFRSIERCWLRLSE